MIQVLDEEAEGVIDVNLFLFYLRGNPNERRLGAIDSAFKRFDRDGSGFIDIRDLKWKFYKLFVKNLHWIISKIKN